MAKEKVKKPFYKKWWVWVIAIVIAFNLAGGDEDTKETSSEPKATETTTETDTTSTEPETTEEEVAEEAAPVVEEEAPAEPEKPSMTVSQESAVQKAEIYINNMGGFSKSGLIKQLEFEKFSKEDSAFAVENIDVDWNEQAKIKAEAYMDNMGGFSRQGLIDQLKFEGFTDEEANYGADQVGL